MIKTLETTFKRKYLAEKYVSALVTTRSCSPCSTWLPLTLLPVNENCMTKFAENWQSRGISDWNQVRQDAYAVTIQAQGIFTQDLNQRINAHTKNYCCISSWTHTGNTEAWITHKESFWESRSLKGIQQKWSLFVMVKVNLACNTA